jgi:hypothetical protein
LLENFPTSHQTWEVARHPRRLFADEWFHPVVLKIDHSSGIGALRMAINALGVVDRHALLNDPAAGRGSSGKQSSRLLVYSARLAMLARSFS